MYSTSLFALVFELIANIYLDLKYDLYGYFDKGPDWRTLPTLILIFPAVNLLFLNFYPFTRSKTIQLIYILICSIIGVVFEWIYIQTDFFYHNEWKLRYSLVSYPFIFYILTLNIRYIRKMINNK
ncbi:hypothetical protein EKG37_18160 [Robertmurraya yapensis]|uniref:Uncharacterized protein n=1 Tax=Bacillus yapensis TaxID=2492960 RepID=A0A431VXN4_9BACI|nr:CBO0543 family protein [Bacillus yapensis]RTR27903.1 hypothetical protein EKG37_18160 [Bacillus yapensis]TKS94306.1 hypothetical protein FAR12_18170 [Bacillus yapensis]